MIRTCHMGRLARSVRPARLVRPVRSMRQVLDKAWLKYLVKIYNLLNKYNLVLNNYFN